MEIRFGWQVAGRIFRSQVSAIGYQVRVFWFWCRFGEIVCPTANRLPLTPIVGRGATAWRPWADGRWWVGLLALLMDPVSANGRDAVAPLPRDASPCHHVTLPTCPLGVGYAVALKSQNPYRIQKAPAAQR
jgi:hypothetical protein